MIDSLLYAKLPPKLKRSVNMARLENGSYEENMAHLERELELKALGESDDLPIATRREICCLMALIPTRIISAHTARLKLISGKTVQNSKRKKN